MAAIARTIGALGILLTTLSVASQALAEAALFQGTAQRISFLGTSTLPVQGGPTKAGNLQGGTGPAGFTLPSGIWGTAFTANFSYPPRYLNITANVDRKILAGDFTKSFFTPNASYTMMHNEVAYPNAAPTSSASGFLRMKIGPNGFGGPMVVRRQTTYLQTVTAPIGSSMTTFAGTFSYGVGKVGTDPYRDCCQFGTKMNLVTGGTNGSVWAWDPTNAFATGTITQSMPTGVAATVRTQMAADARNAAGTSGTIQLVAPRLTYAYTITGTPPPKDGTATLSGLQFASSGIVLTSLSFLPEPGSALMLGSGILAMLALLHWRRRS